MIKIVAAEQINDHEIRLRFSDDSHGIFDFAPFIAAGTPMTGPLRDPDFFRRFYLEMGALAWPNGFDLSAASLQRKLDDDGRLDRSSAAA
jgi:hypothetical protein